MKRALTTAGFALALLLCLGAALAAGGDAGDPLLSLSYLTEQFSISAEYISKCPSFIDISVS